MLIRHSFLRHFCFNDVREMKQYVLLTTKKSCMVLILTIYLLTYVTRIHEVTYNFIAMNLVTVTLEPYFINWTLIENISCHYYGTEGDALPSAGDLTPPEDSIYFLETSCRGGLNSRQACAVESVARIHPHRSIYIFFNSPVSEVVLTRSCLAKLIQFKNVKVARLHVAEYAKGSVLDEMLAGKKNEETEWKVEWTSDILRYITLYKYGGVYLDTDVLVVRHLDALGNNWAAREDNQNINVAVAAFTKRGIGHQLLSIILQNIKYRHRSNVWGEIGPGAMTRAVVKLCLKTHVSQNNTSDFACNGFKIYNPSVLYPVNWRQADIYFKPGKLPDDADQAFTHHLWNKLSQNLTVEAGSPYDKLSRLHCPAIREMYGDRFGW